MTSDSWDVLAAWSSDWAVVRPLGGGQRNTVALVEVDRMERVARRSRRSGASLDWETGLLRELDRRGVGVPGLVPARQGELHVDGCVVMETVHGRLPASASDWSLVGAALRRLHHLTSGWPQRPGFASARDMLSRTRGGDIDLSAMPADAVARCRSAWRPLVDRSRAVVHGDPGAENVRLANERVIFLDWDESRVDVPLFDLAAVPPQASGLDPVERDLAEQAAHAWEAANGWLLEPDYARRRLAQVRGAD